MKPFLRRSSLAAAALTAAVLLSTVPADFSAFAQTATAPASALSEPTIKALQEALNKQGIAVKTDGILTDETRAAVRKYQSQHHLPVTGEPDSATLEKLGVAAQRSSAPGATPPAAAGAGGMMGGPGTGMMGGGMGPQMMQSMPQGMMGSGMMGQGMMGQGMMGRGQMPMMGGGMPMQGGMMMCPMMSGMMGMQPGMMRGRMEAMSSQTLGSGLIYGAPSTELSVDEVKAMLEQTLAAHGNPRLAIGKISEKDESTIVAEIVTKDGSLVQRLAFNRYPGVARQLP